MRNAIAAFALEYNDNILFKRKIISDLIICRTHQSAPDYSSPNVNLTGLALLCCLQTPIYLQLLSTYPANGYGIAKKGGLQ